MRRGEEMRKNEHKLIKIRFGGTTNNAAVDDLLAFNFGNYFYYLSPFSSSLLTQFDPESEKWVTIEPKSSTKPPARR